MNKYFKREILPVLSLFTSVSTLICCALPALFVSLGLGATLAGIVTAVPQLIWISEHKGLVFGAAAFFLILAGLSMYANRNAPCPIDQKKAQACQRARKLSLVIYLVSVILFCVGAYFAFLIVP